MVLDGWGGPVSAREPLQEGAEVRGERRHTLETQGRPEPGVKPPLGTANGKKTGAPLAPPGHTWI